MRSSPRHLLATIVVILTACDQQPAGIPLIADDLPWRTISSFPEAVVAGPVWGTSPNDVYLAYRSSSNPDEILLHFDGVAWQPAAFNRLVSDIWGSGSSDVYVASYGPLYRYDGSDWTEIPGIAALWVTGSAPDDVYAGNPGDVFHFDGNAWEHVLESRYIDAFWAGPGNTALAAVNSRGVDSLRWWDGNAWSGTESPGRIAALWGADEDHIVAVGTNSTYTGAIWTWNGASWSADTVPADLPPLFDVDGTTASDIIVVGGEGTILRYDGALWQPIVVPTRMDLNRVWTSGPASGYVTGVGGVVLSSAGGDWEPVFDHPVQGSGPMWAEDRETILIGSGSGVHAFENGSWHEETIEEHTELTAIAGRSRDDLYAALYSYGIYHYDGLHWTSVMDSARDVSDMYVLPDGNVCALDRNEGLFTFDGTGWNHVQSPDNVYGYGSGAIWASALDDIWMVVGGSVVRYDGTTTRVVDPLAHYNQDVWGRGANDVYVVGEDGIWHFDGYAFRKLGPTRAFTQVTGSGGRVLVTGSGHAYLADGYWHYSPEPARVVERLITAVDGTIMALATRDGRTLEIQRLPAGPW